MNNLILNTPGDADKIMRSAASRQMDFEIEQRDDICIVRIRGRMAAGANVDHLRMKVQAIKNSGCNKLIADICDLDSIGSDGIGFFVDLYTSTTRDTGGRFALASPSARVLEVLTLTGLSTIIPIVKDVAAAFAYCARDGDKARHVASSLG